LSWESGISGAIFETAFWVARAWFIITMALVPDGSGKYTPMVSRNGQGYCSEDWVRSPISAPMRARLKRSG
jgi:hypothetical protein